MTFISTQSFDADGEIKVVKSKRKILESGEVNEDGKLVGKARVKAEYECLTRDDLVPCGNLRAAEAMALDEMEIFWPSSSPPLNHIPAEAQFAHRISMAAANIANMSKRGVGNTIVCHPSVRARVDECWDKTKKVKEFNPETEDMDIELVKPYFPNGPLEVIENDLAPDDSVLVLYRGAGEEDQPLIYVEGEGLLLNSKVADVETYGKFVRIP